MSEIDVAKVRAETPAAERLLHFNNAGSALPPNCVVRAVTEHIELEAAIGGYEAYEAKIAAIDNCHTALARLINSSRDEIAVVDCATRAWDMAFYGQKLGPGDRILTSRSEYSSNFIAFLHVAKKSGATVSVVPDDDSGQLSIAALERMLEPDVKLVAVTHVPTSGGLVNPAAAIGRLTRQAGVPFLLDACQSCGQMPIDVEEIGCDMLSGTARKYLRGPRGVGFLYVRRAMLERMEPPFLDDHAATWTSQQEYTIRDDARRFETWESYVAGRIGLAVAVDYALDIGLGPIAKRIRHLATYLRSALAALKGVTTHDQGVDQCGIVTFSVTGLSADEIKKELRAQAMNVTVSTREATLIDMTARGLERIVRASVHYYNTEEEIDRFVGSLAQISRLAA